MNLKRNIKRTFVIFALFLTLVVSLIIGCSNNTESIILSTTTSTRDSGLLDEILPYFENETGIVVKVIAVGTGKALQMGVDGEADVLLVHAKASEEKFVSDGDGIERFDVMYNDFVLVGPKSDHNTREFSEMKTLETVLMYINDNQLTFLSRGDDSGTNKKEMSLWHNIAIEPDGDWYLSAGKGMGDVLVMTSELQAYTLTDRATYLSMQDKLDLEIVFQTDPALINYYGVIAVNPDKNNQINSKGADLFIEWLLSDSTQKKIENYGIEEFGQPLFFPNAK